MDEETYLGLNRLKCGSILAPPALTSEHCFQDVCIEHVSLLERPLQSPFYTEISLGYRSGVLNDTFAEV